MSPWLLLVPVAAVNLLGAWLTFTHRVHAAWTPAAMTGLGAASGFAWWYGSRRLTQADKVAYTIVWDAVVFTAYLAFPVVALGVRPTPATWLGFILVALGMLIVTAQE